MAIYVAKRTSGEGWTSFESDPHLTVTRRRIYQRCAPCLEGMLEQLIAGLTEVELGYAWSCFKIAVVLPDLDQCWRFLRIFDDRNPQQYVYGKFGSGSKNRPTRAVVFHTDSTDRQQELLPLVDQSASMLGVDATVFVSRGCADPYEFILGHWSRWQSKMSLPYPDRVPEAIVRLRQILYRG